MSVTSPWSATVSITEQGGKSRNFPLDDFVGIALDESKLLDQLQEHPAKFAYIAQLHASAIVARERTEERSSFVEAELYLEVRAKRGDLKLTGDEVKAMVRTSKKYVAINEEYLKAHEQEEKLKAIRDALNARKDIMLLIANNYKRTRDTDPGARLDHRSR